MEYIDPKQLMQTLSIEELCETAERYYQSVEWKRVIAKPFVSIQEMPELLYNTSILFSSMYFAKTMTVLDFGAGSCWLSKMMNEMQLCTISLDCSPTALEYGKRLFEQYPIIGEYIQPPQFKCFDGRRIDLPDESVDRIISFDAFHHVPNQREILSEFFRVLKDGGIVGFSEPGPHHSSNPQSQAEMKNYTVLENDILLDEIKAMSEEIGFSKLIVKHVTNPYYEFGYDEYTQMLQGEIPNSIQSSLIQPMRDKTIFYLYKGTVMHDSRSHSGLYHRLESDVDTVRSERGKPFHITFQITNTGTAKWLTDNICEIGVVKLAAHLYSGDRKLINFDFFRSKFEQETVPEQTIEKTVEISIAEPGEYILSFDLVSESVNWFEILGSKPKDIHITII